MLKFSKQMKQTIDRTRRSMGDLDGESDLTDENIFYYIRDAVEELESEYKHGITVYIYEEEEDEVGDFFRGGEKTQINNTEKMIISLKTHICIKLGIKDKADRENFFLKKNKLSIDTTKQSNDHDQTLDRLEKKLKDMIYRAEREKIRGVRVE